VNPLRYKGFVGHPRSLARQGFAVVPLRGKGLRVTPPVPLRGKGLRVRTRVRRYVSPA